MAGLRCMECITCRQFGSPLSGTGGCLSRLRGYHFGGPTTRVVTVAVLLAWLGSKVPDFTEAVLLMVEPAAAVTLTVRANAATPLSFMMGFLQATVPDDPTDGVWHVNGPGSMLTNVETPADSTSVMVGAFAGPGPPL